MNVGMEERGDIERRREGQRGEPLSTLVCEFVLSLSSCAPTNVAKKDQRGY